MNEERLIDDPRGTLGATSLKVRELRSLCEQVQVATFNLGTKYLELVLFLRGNPVTEMTARQMMRQAGMNQARISEIFRVVRAPDVVVDAFKGKLIGFKAAVKVARLKEGPKLDEPDRHISADRVLFKAWERFVREWSHLVTVAEGLPVDCYLGEDPRGPHKAQLVVGTKHLRPGGSINFQFGRFKVTLFRWVETEKERKEFRQYCEVFQAEFKRRYSAGAIEGAKA